MGIHNEPGIQKLPLKSTAELVETMLTKITETSDKDRSFVPFKGDGSDEVVLMVNDLGSISELEMGGITNEGKSYHYPRFYLACRSCVMYSCSMATKEKYQGPTCPIWYIHDLAQHARILPHPPPPP